MNFEQALILMMNGKKVTRKSWLKNDYLYICKGRIMCDGGFEYSLRVKELRAVNWQEYTGDL